MLATSVAAQQTDTLPPKPPGNAGSPAIPCCVITAVDSRTGRVNARESSTGYTFSFEVKNPKLRADVKVGQKIWADFSTKRVSLKRGTACCDIVAEVRPP